MQADVNEEGGGTAKLFLNPNRTTAAARCVEHMAVLRRAAMCRSR